MSTTINATGIQFTTNEKYKNLETKDNSQIYFVPSPPVVIETWVSSDGLSWYRKYSDGWIEQGGQISVGTSNTTDVTVNFPTAFSDKKYFIVKSFSTNSQSSSFRIDKLAFWSKSTSKAITKSPIDVTSQWYACGY